MNEWVSEKACLLLHHFRASRGDYIFRRRLLFDTSLWLKSRLGGSRLGGSRLGRSRLGGGRLSRSCDLFSDKSIQGIEEVWVAILKLPNFRGSSSTTRISR